MKVLYPGTFDPVTYGHLDVIKRAAPMFEHVVVAVSNHGRKDTLFTSSERIELMRTMVTPYPNVEVVTFDNLAVDCAVQNGAAAVLRGLRVTSDFEYEFTMAKFMAEQNCNIQPVYLMADAKLTHISSTAVKEIAKLNGDVNLYVPKYVEEALQDKLNQLKNVA